MKKGMGRKRLEKRAYLTWHGDGLVDIGLGLLVLLFGMGMKYDQTLLAPIYGCVGYPIWIYLKQHVTEKRLGYVEFGEPRKKRERKGWILLFILGCFVFCFGIMGYILVMDGGGTGGLGKLPGYLMISVIFAVLVSSVGVVLELWRLYLYSVLILMFGSAGHMLGWKPESGIILPGALVVTFGFIYLISFLRKYPKVDLGADSMGEGGAES